MPLQPKVRVAVAPVTEYDVRRSLFDMLGSELEISFEPHAPGQYEGLCGLIALPGSTDVVQGASGRGISCYEVNLSQLGPLATQSAITFSASTAVHGAFRNKTLADPNLVTLSRIPDSFEPLANAGGQPVWGVEPHGDYQHHCVGVDVPVFKQGENFYSYFRELRWFSMVPLLHFLRGLLGPNAWPASAPRASFIIDDPNLHHRSYGYIDFEGLASHAATHNYHATIATVPLDTWYFDRKVVDFFQRYKKHISLMMHGVNHVADELARSYEEGDALSLLATGLRRITDFESRSGVTVARIMAAPHGAFAESIADLMLRLGYEAACVSIGSLLRWNPKKVWPTNLGFSLAQSFGNLAFPVFHRVGISEVEIRLKGFLGHPVIVAMHHQDCISNFARLESLAKIINENSDVQWMGIEDISRSNFVSKRQNGMVQIWPHSRHFKFPLSPRIDAVQVCSSPYSQGFMIDLHDDRPSGAELTAVNARASYKITDCEMEVFFNPTNRLDYKQVASKSVGIWPIVRRLLTEARDRTKPILSLASAR